LKQRHPFDAALMQPNHHSSGSIYASWAEVPCSRVPFLGQVHSMASAQDHSMASAPVAGGAPVSSGSESEDSGSESERSPDFPGAIDVSTGAEYDSFDILRAAVSRKCSCKLSLNCRKFPPQHALKWVKDANPGLAMYHQSGCFYCYRPFDETNRQKHARTSCPMLVSYVFSRSLKWKITHVSLNHNHEVEAAGSYVGVTGTRYVSKMSDLSQDELGALNHWLETHMTTRLVRYHFRQKFAGSEITRRCVRAARTALKPDDPHAMDRLVALMETYQKGGGVGKIMHRHFRIETIIMQHPLMRKVAKAFGKVTTVDGTHNTSKYDHSTLLNATSLDSFGKMAPIGCVYNESENESSLIQLLEELGILDVLVTLITDNSKAALAFALRHPLIAHILCRWHWFKNFNKVMDQVTHKDKKVLYDAVNKVIKWRG
jgi:hypothetical protein